MAATHLQTNDDYKTKKTKHVTTAYRQNNYLIVDNQHNSVTVSVYFRVSKRNIIKPNFKKTIRSIKNKAHNFDEGQILLRELTSDTQLLPKKTLLIKLSKYLNKYESTMDIPTFEILWKRLTDYQTLRHVEKTLLVIEYLINKQQNEYYSVSFEKYLKKRKHEFVKLQNYHYKIDGSDIGQNVRQRANNIYQILFVDENINPIPTKLNEEDDESIDVAGTTPLPTSTSPLPPIVTSGTTKSNKKRKKKKKKKRKKIDDIPEHNQQDNIITEDLLTFGNSNTVDVTQVEGTNDNPFRVDNNGNHDPFDIFGELPQTQQPQQNDGGNVNGNDHTASFHDLLSNSTAISATTTPGMPINNNNINNNNGNSNSNGNNGGNYHDFGVNNFDNMFDF